MLIHFRVLSHCHSSEHYTCCNIFRICTRSPLRFTKEKCKEQGLYVIKTTSQGHTVTGVVLFRLVTHMFETFWTAQNCATNCMNCIGEFPFTSFKYQHTSTLRSVKSVSAHPLFFLVVPDIRVLLCLRLRPIIRPVAVMWRWRRIWILVGKPQGRRSHRRPRHRWETGDCVKIHPCTPSTPLHPLHTAILNIGTLAWRDCDVVVKAIIILTI
jgi:hypothetical protein